ncbi:MAG: hypothetical protein M3250_03285, partial [Thermoproteota archaeon]|nr:hypothetical protein [Thermoproteota archaeon]
LRIVIEKGRMYTNLLFLEGILNIRLSQTEQKLLSYSCMAMIAFVNASSIIFQHINYYTGIFVKNLCINLDSINRLFCKGCSGLDDLMDLTTSLNSYHTKFIIS